MAAANIDEITAGVGGLSLPITVLSWNINGPGKAEARRKMIDSVVEHIDPDVMLLQETKQSITQPFNKKWIASGKYNCEQSEDKEEAQVFYKKSTYEKVSTSKVNLDNILEEMFPANQTANELRSGSVPARKVIKERICVVHLRHKLTKREIVFISYHNIRKGGGLGAVKEKANEVCQIIAKIHASSKCCVIAGVDFNCSNFDCANVTVPEYDATPRRKEKSKVDFFLLSEPAASCRVEAFDLFPSEEAPFFKKLESLLVVNTQEEYDKSLDHDPLKLSLE